MLRKVVIALVFLLVASSLIFWRIEKTTHQKRIASGDTAVNLIEFFKKRNGRLPDSLEEVGMFNKQLLYKKWDSAHYMVWFKRSFGDATSYDSHTKEWKDF
jgi:hypothetical protein